MNLLISDSANKLKLLFQFCIILFLLFIQFSIYATDNNSGVLQVDFKGTGENQPDDYKTNFSQNVDSVFDDNETTDKMKQAYSQTTEDPIPSSYEQLMEDSDEDDCQVKASEGNDLGDWDYSHCDQRQKAIIKKCMTPSAENTDPGNLDDKLEDCVNQSNDKNQDKAVDSTTTPPIQNSKFICDEIKTLIAGHNPLKIPNDFKNVEDISEKRASGSLNGGIKYAGSQKFKECLGKTDSDWKDMKNGESGHWEPYWKYHFVLHAKGINDKISVINRECISQKSKMSNAKLYQDDAQKKIAINGVKEDSRNRVSPLLEDLRRAIQASADAAVDIYNELLLCETYIAVTVATDNIDYEDSEHTRPSRDSSVSFDGKIKCSTRGAETQDYPTCKNLVVAYDAARISKSGFQTYQSLDTQSKSMEVQLDYVTKEKKEITDGLESQKKMVDHQAEKAEEMAGFDGAKLGILSGFVMAFPTGESLEETCLEEKSKLTSGYTIIQVSYEHYTNALKDLIKKETADYITAKNEESTAPNGKTYSEINNGGGDMTTINLPSGDLIAKDTKADTLCGNLIFSSPNALIENRRALQAAKAEMAKAGIDLASDIAKAALLKNQSGLIQDVIDGVDKSEPETAGILDANDLYIPECQADPASENCRLATLDATHAITGMGDFNIGGNGEASTIGGASNDLDENGDEDNAIGDGTPPGPVTAIGSKNTPSNKKSGLADRPIPKGKVTYKPKTAGGGGGGGSAGGGGAGGGGGGGDDRRGGGGGAGRKIGSIGYDGGGGGSLRFGGSGKGNNRRKKRSKGNPFGKMFKKRKGINEIRFGRKIGKVEDGLFNMLSRQYSKAVSQKKVHTYVQNKK